MERRDVFRILAVTAAGAPLAAQHAHSAEKGKAPANYKPRFFSPEEYAAAGHLCALLIPSDDEGPGALEAGVPFYLDTVMLYADPGVQAVWRSGLAALDRKSHEVAGKSFSAASDKEREDVLESIAANESAPETEFDRFFIRARTAIIEGFCQSAEGIRFLGYKGNTGIYTFPGCTHPAHSET